MCRLELITLASCVNRSKPSPSLSVNTPTGVPSSTTTTAPWARLWISESASAIVASGRERDRRLEHRVAPLHVVDHLGHDVDGDVLGKDRDPTATGDRFGHAPARHRGHVRHDDRNGRADAVGRPQVDAHPRRNVGQARNHEHVAVGQVVARVGMKHAHGWWGPFRCRRSDLTWSVRRHSLWKRPQARP